MLDAAPTAEAVTPAVIREVPLPTNALRALLPIASTDETRSNLNTVYVTAKGGTLTMVATDGHRLARVERECDADVEVDGVSIPRATVKEALSLAGAGRNRKPIVIAATEWKSKAGQAWDRTRTVVLRVGDATLPIDESKTGQFVNYVQVIPKNIDALKPTTAAFNLKYLADFELLANLDIDDKHCAAIDGMVSADEFTPIVVKMRSYRTLAILMPIRPRCQ